MPTGEGEHGFAKRPTTQQRDDAILLFLLFNRQTGTIADCVRHIAFYHEWEGYADYMKTELADLSFLIKRMCHVMEFDYEEVAQLGTDRDEEKKRLYLELHPRARWV